MNLPELLIFISIFMGGYYSGNYLGHFYGMMGYIGGFIIGCGLIVSIYILLRYLSFLQSQWDPTYYPDCVNPECEFNHIDKPRNKDDYEKVKTVPDGVVLRCPCGVKYYFTGRRFMVLLADGHQRSYMIRGPSSFFWEKDRTDKEIKDMQQDSYTHDEGRD